MSSQVSPGSVDERKWTKKLRDSLTRKNSAKKTDFADDISEVASVDVKMPPLDLVQGEKKKKSLRRRLSGSFKKMLTPRSSLSGPMRSDSLARTNSLAYDDDASTKDFMEEEVSLPSSPVQTAEIVRAPSMPLEAGAVGTPEPEQQQAAEARRAEVEVAPAPAEEEPAQADDDLLEPVAEEPAAEEAATDAAPEEEAAPAPAAAAAAESPFSAYLAQAAGMMEVAAPEDPAAAAAAEGAAVAEEAEVEVSAAAEEPAQAAAAAAAAKEPAVLAEAEVETPAMAVPEEEAAVEAAPAVAEEAAGAEVAYSAARSEDQAEEEAAVEEPAMAEEPAVADEPTAEEEEQEEAAPALFIEESTGSLTYDFQASPTATADLLPDSPADDAAGAGAIGQLEAEAVLAETEEEEEEEEGGPGALHDEASGSSYSALPEVVAGSTLLPYPAPKAVLLFPTVSTSSTGILVPDTPQAWDPAEEVSKSASSGALAGMDSGAASDSGNKSAGEEEEEEPAQAPAVEAAPVEAAELCRPVGEAVTKEVVVVEEAEAEVDAEEGLVETPAPDVKAPEAPIAAIPTAVSKGTRGTRRGRGHGLLRTLAKTALLGAAVGAVALATGGLPMPKQAKRAERSRAGAKELAVTAALEPAERDGPLAALSQWWGVYMSQ